jgi:3-isopropylmalate/(R)-2-methylmalate dehydratase small subunit
MRSMNGVTWIAANPAWIAANRPLNPDFVLNQARYQGASVLLARENFGCGSSREHAPWALEDYGFRAIIAPSFADIFFNNCFKNGVLPIVLAADVVDRLFKEAATTEGYRLDIDLAAQNVTTPAGEVIHFEVDGERKHRLLNGLDDIALTLQYTEQIKAYESRRRQEASWLFI